MRASPNNKGWAYMPFEERFKASYTVDQKTWCWNWVKGKGYGWITYERRWVPAHRAAWLHFKGPIPKGMCALHKCDNLKCVNYKKHLYIGSKKHNRADFMARHPKAKELIKQLIKNGTRGVNRFWASMTQTQRKEFSMRRRRQQSAKYAGIPGKGH